MRSVSFGNAPFLRTIKSFSAVGKAKFLGFASDFDVPFYDFYKKILKST